MVRERERDKEGEQCTLLKMEYKIRDKKYIAGTSYKNTCITLHLKPNRLSPTGKGFRRNVSLVPNVCDLFLSEFQVEKQKYIVTIGKIQVKKKKKKSTKFVPLNSGACLKGS